MEGVDRRNPEIRPLDRDGWSDRIERSRTAMRTVQQDTARVSDAIAATEQTVAATLRRLAAADRAQGRTAVAERREARAHVAERFAARERAAAEELTGNAAEGAAGR